MFTTIGTKKSDGASMPRKHFVFRNGDWVEYDRYAPRPKRTILISDTMAPTLNPATNKTYDSKSQYYADTKAAGGVIVGNELSMKGPPVTKNPEPVPVTIERLNQKMGWDL